MMSSVESGGSAPLDENALFDRATEVVDMFTQVKGENFSIQVDSLPLVINGINRNTMGLIAASIFVEHEMSNNTSFSYASISFGLPRANGAYLPMPDLIPVDWDNNPQIPLESLARYTSNYDSENRPTGETLFRGTGSALPRRPAPFYDQTNLERSLGEEFTPYVWRMSTMYSEAVRNVSNPEEVVLSRYQSRADFELAYKLITKAGIGHVAVLNSVSVPTDKVDNTEAAAEHDLHLSQLFTTVPTLVSANPHQVEYRLRSGLSIISSQGPEYDYTQVQAEDGSRTRTEGLNEYLVKILDSLEAIYHRTGEPVPEGAKTNGERLQKFLPMISPY